MVTWAKCRVPRVTRNALSACAHPSANGWRQLTSSSWSFLSLRMSWRRMSIISLRRHPIPPALALHAPHTVSLPSPAVQDCSDALHQRRRQWERPTSARRRQHPLRWWSHYSRFPPCLHTRRDRRWPMAARRQCSMIVRADGDPKTSTPQPRHADTNATQTKITPWEAQPGKQRI